MFRTCDQRVRLLVLLISVFLIRTVAAWDSNSRQPPPKEDANPAGRNVFNQDFPPASVQATPMKTVSVDPTTTASSVHSKQRHPEHGSFPNTYPQHSGSISSKQRRRNKTHKRAGDPARTLFEMQYAIRALATTHNELLRSLTRNEPWWYRYWILISWSYSKSHLINNDKRLYTSLKGLTNFTLDERVIQTMIEGDAVLPEEIKTYLQDLRCAAHSQTVQASPKPYSLFLDEDWRKWKERLQHIRQDVHESMLKYEFEKQAHALLDKIEAFHDDFSNQYFRSHATWIYYYESSWLNAIFKTGSGVGNAEGVLTKRLRRYSKTLADMFKALKEGITHGWELVVAPLSHLDLLKWLEASKKTPSFVSYLLKAIIGVAAAPILMFINDPVLYRQGIHCLIGVSFLYIVSFLFKQILKLMAVLPSVLPWGNGQGRRMIRRAPVEDTMNFSEVGNNKTEGSQTLCSRGPKNDNMERIQLKPSSRPLEVETVRTRPKETPVERTPLFPLSRENLSSTSNESEVSFKMAKASKGITRKGIHVRSINDHGPIPRAKVTDSIRVGGRRINMVYDTEDGGLVEDSGDEIVAVVSSSKENDVNQTGKPVAKKHATQAGNRSDAEYSDMMRGRAVQRKARRRPEDSKRILVDASNASHTTEDTRVLRSRTNSITTKSTDGLSKRDAKEKSAIPRRRSARLSAVHMNET